LTAALSCAKLSSQQATKKMKIKNLLKKNSPSYDWILLSDYYMEMAMVLMVILSMTTTNKMRLEEEISKVQSITSTWKDTKDIIYNALLKEFKDDLKVWDATLDKETLSIRFNEPSIQFNTGSYQLRNEFAKILSNFWPRYIKIVRQYADAQIQEIRIEGHTSSIWFDGASKTASYFGNMELSQARARTVLMYCYNLNTLDNEWASKYITANGLSSSKLVLNDDNTENHKLSQRVEFRIVLNTESKINEILDGGHE